MEMVGRAFVDHYYNLFDNNRPSLSSLYQSSSMLTFEGLKIQGVEDITKKLTELPFEHCHHVISTMDAQPSSIAGGILVFVSGSLQLQGEEHALRFSQVILHTLFPNISMYCSSLTFANYLQMFHLIPTAEASFFVLNDVFRLNYG